MVSILPVSNVAAPALAGLELGIALAGAPGPVQAILLTESVRGGTTRGFRAMAGANLTFAALLVSLALGVTILAPGGAALRVLKIVGGAFLIWIAQDGFRAQSETKEVAADRRTLPPPLRGALAVLLNPGAWIFLGTAASSLFASVTRTDGTGSALIAALALVFGLAMGDGAVVLFGGMGVRRAGERVGLWIRRGLALALAALGLWLLINGLVG
jgi:threonine/homoserine/homoserine lactone efflux protein